MSNPYEAEMEAEKKSRNRKTTAEITEESLRSLGFKYHEVQGRKHWLLWIAEAIKPVYSDLLLNSREDLGVELSAMDLASDLMPLWHCWIRADYSGRYSRFLHVRYMKHVGEIPSLITGLIGYPFDPANAYYGSLLTPENAARARQRDERDLHRQLAREWGKRVEAQTGADPDKRELLNP